MGIKGGIAVGLKLGTLGFKTKGVTPQQIIDDREYFSELLTKYKVVAFSGLQPTRNEHLSIQQSLYCGNSEVSLTNALNEQQHHEHINDVNDWMNRDYFIHQNWHIDHAFYEHTTSLLSMHMTVFTCPQERGQTYFVSLIDLYESLPQPLKDALQTALFEHSNGTDSVVHPALRTHPITGETALYWKDNGVSLHGTDSGWFSELKHEVNKYLLNPDNWWSWSWSAGDLVIWDNRCLLHSFGPGWDHNERVFTRGNIGQEKPFYDPSFAPLINDEFGDAFTYKGISRDSSKGPNPDHIPLVFTHGIYGLPEMEEHYQKVTLISITPNLTPSVTAFIEHFKDQEDFHVEVITPSRPHLFKHLFRYAHRFFDAPIDASHAFLVSRNGDVMRGLNTEHDLLTWERTDPETPTPVELVNGLLSMHPDMRHAGHGWHYPDWFPHQPLQERPWSYRNLPFYRYNQEPSEDFLVQFAIDTVYGCFNHLEDDQDRLQVVERVRDYITYMIESGEYRHDR